MISKRERTLHYRRALFFVDTEYKFRLEYFIDIVHDMFSSLEDRRVVLSDNTILECRRYQKSNRGIFMQVVAYSPGEEMSIVPHSTKKNDHDLGTTPPPENADFWDGDINVLVKDNHVVLCTSNLHEKVIEKYLVGMFQKKGFDDGALMFALRKTAPIDKVKLIRQQGIKCLKLGSTLYEASVDHVTRTTVKNAVLRSVWNALSDYFREDESLASILASENVSAEVLIKFDSRKKGGELAHSKLEEIAEKVVQENEGDGNGFVIITGDDQKIRAADLSLSKHVSVIAHGKTVKCDDCWSQIKTYYQELYKIGALEL